MTGYEITKEKITPIGDLSYREALQLTFVAMECFTKQAIEAFSKSEPKPSEEELKQFKDNLHDEIVIFCSALAESVSPTPSDSDPSPATPSTPSSEESTCSE